EVQNLVITGTLPEGVSVSYSEGLKDVGTKTITATFTGDAENYNIIASKEATLTIVAKTLEEEMFDSIPEQAFTGSAITPVVTGKFGEITLVEGTDFEVAYADNTAKGTAKVTVTGKGNYSGTVELTFTIGASSLEKVQTGRMELETKYASSLSGTIASDLTRLDVATTNGCKVQWSSNTTAFSVESDGTISMLQSESEQEVTLVATVVDGESYEQTTFVFTIPAGEVIQTKTIQEMIDAPVDAKAYYKVTGIVSNITNTTNGYFDLVDPTDPSVKIYVFKLLTAKDGEAGKFNTLNIVEGDTLTLIGTRGVYNSKIEILNAYYVSHEKTTVTVSTDYESTQGNVVLDQTTVENGTEVTITITPAEGYEVSSVKAIVNGEETVISKNAEGEYKYVVSFNTSIAVEFALAGTTPTYEYILVTDASSLEAGKEIIIVAKEYNYALSTTQNSSNRGQASIVKSDEKISSIGSDVQVITLESGTKEGTFAFNVGTGYLYAASSSSNHLKTQKSNNDDSSWLITIDSNGVATIKAQGANTHNLLKYNSQSKLFSCYASGQQDVQIYVRIEVK
ncbi:MAG: immunoglobulin-like domain-containing protein, partial [Bacilli bacterium]